MKKTIHKSILLASFASVLFLTSTTTSAKIYKWTDAKGQVHYTAQPPAQTKVRIKAENIEDKIRANAGKGYSKSKKAKARDEEEKEEENLSGPDKKLLEYCNNQRENLQQLQKNFRNVWIDVKGKKTTLNQEQRKEKVSVIKKQITENCEDVKASS